ncbi:MAG: hypothetical protein PVH91_07515 [Pseudomonadales bacterium]
MPRQAPDWRIWLGLSLTLAWLVLGAYYVAQDVGWGTFLKMPAADLGNFFEGAFAPLAFLWLVIGYFLQKKELEQNTQALRAQAEEIQRTAEQAVIQSEKMAETEFHARQEAFLQIYRAVRSQLGTIAGFLFISSQSSLADGTVTPEEQSKLFAESGQDTEIFSRRLLETHFALGGQPQAQYDLFYGTPVRARHANSFIYTFERLLARAEAVDPDNMIRDALLTGGHGIVYSLARMHQIRAPAELASHEVTGLYFNF